MRPIRQTEVVILIPQLADFVEYASRTNPRLEGRSLLKHRFRIDISMKNLFVGNLSYAIDNQQMHALFSPFGQVQSANVVMDRVTGQSKGFGFVAMAENEAKAAISELHGKEIQGRPLTVNEAKPRASMGPAQRGPSESDHPESVFSRQD